MLLCLFVAGDGRIYAFPHRQLLGLTMRVRQSRRVVVVAPLLARRCRNNRQKLVDGLGLQRCSTTSNDILQIGGAKGSPEAALQLIHAIDSGSVSTRSTTRTRINNLLLAKK
jgi:hypothetical protein